MSYSSCIFVNSIVVELKSAKYDCRVMSYSSCIFVIIIVESKSTKLWSLFTAMFAVYYVCVLNLHFVTSNSCGGYFL
jgi:hypothetical protein